MSSSSEESETGSTDGWQYEVEEVVDKRIVEEKPQYLIKWKDFGSDANTWEPMKHLNCYDLINEFEARAAREPPKAKTFSATKASYDQKVKEEKMAMIASYTLIKEKYGENGFDQGFLPESIKGATKDTDGELFFLMKFKEAEEPELVCAKEAKVKCPEIVVKYYNMIIANPLGKMDDDSEEGSE